MTFLLVQKRFQSFYKLNSVEILEPGDGQTERVGIGDRVIAVLPRQTDVLPQWPCLDSWDN
jgi:hypothetical protein